jgi:hypothetical protein
MQGERKRDIRYRISDIRKRVGVEWATGNRINAEVAEAWRTRRKEAREEKPEKRKRRRETQEHSEESLCHLVARIGAGSLGRVRGGFGRVR